MNSSLISFLRVKKGWERESLCCKPSPFHKEQNQGGEGGVRSASRMRKSVCVSVEEEKNTTTTPFFLRLSFYLSLSLAFALILTLSLPFLVSFCVRCPLLLQCQLSFPSFFLTPERSLHDGHEMSAKKKKKKKTSREWEREGERENERGRERERGTLFRPLLHTLIINEETRPLSVVRRKISQRK